MACGGAPRRDEKVAGMNSPTGFAVLDTETTGILPGFRHGIAEIAIVHVDPNGVVTDEWSTLINPQRDLGPQKIHGIRPAEVRRAPLFSDIAGDVIERLRGRTVVAHNWPFDAMHLRAEFARLDIDTPLTGEAGLCTMRAASLAMPDSGRSLIECCTAAGLPEMDWHTARDDALAAAALLGYLLERCPEAVTVTAAQLAAARWGWPRLGCGVVAPVHRTPVGHVEPHFLARLVERMPRDEELAVDAYFAMLDNALLDRLISATEADALIELAYELGLHKVDAVNAHYTYLRELARAAWADGVVTGSERTDIASVASLLGLDSDTAEEVLDQERHASSHESRISSVTPGGLTLYPGDKVVLTGDMTRARSEISEQATAAGLRVINSVSKKTRVVAAADPDTSSGKARQARALGVPIVSEHAFMHALTAMPPMV